MAGRKIPGFGKILLLPLCLIFIGALMGCAPKIPSVMTPEDLQTCDDTVAQIRAQVTFPVSPVQKLALPYLATPGEAQITAPLNGIVLPFGPVNISFSEPPDPSINYHGMWIYVTPIDSINLSEVFLFNHIYPTSMLNFNGSWTPTASGKFIILVLFRNFRPGGNPNGGPPGDFGPGSVGYACVWIKPPKVDDVIPVGTIMLQTLPIIPTMTQMLTASPTLISSPTFTLSPTIVSSPTFTMTFTKMPTRIPPTSTFTLKPPSPTDTQVTCSGLSQRDCALNSACKWTQPPTGGPGYCENK